MKKEETDYIEHVMKELLLWPPEHLVEGIFRGKIYKGGAKDIYNELKKMIHDSKSTGSRDKSDEGRCSLQGGA